MNEVALSAQDFYLFAPTLILSVFGLGTLLIGILIPKIYRETLVAVVLVGLAAAMFFAVQYWREDTIIFYGMIFVDKFSIGFTCLFIIAAGLTVMVSLNAIEGTSLLLSEYFALIIFATVGMVLMASSAHLLPFFLGLETLSISLYVLAGYKRTENKSLEASFKYFLLGAFASGFLLYGVALIFGSTGSASLINLAEVLSDSETGLLENPLLTTGLALMVVGLGFKIALAPFHAWAPDVYQGSPTPIAGFMATGSKAAGFAALLRLVLASGMMETIEWQKVFWVIAVATMTIGNIVALRQQNVKRLLAYSSIAHAGYILIGVIANNEKGSSAILFYLLSYTFMNIGAFGVISLLSRSDREFVELGDLRGIARYRPFAAVSMSVFMLSLAGIPLTAGFMGKFYIFSAAMESGLLWLVILAVINSMISLYYYLGVIVSMFMQDAPAEEQEFEPVLVVRLALSIAVIATILLGITPARWMETFQDLARSVM